MKTVLKAIFAFTACFLLAAAGNSAMAQCTAPGSISVVQPTNCNTPNGSITIGTPSTFANYQFSKDDGLTFQSSNVFNNLAPGTYQLRTKEIATGCISTRVTQVLNNPATTITSNVGNNTNCTGTPNGTITFTAPASGFTYSINGGSTFQAGASFTSLAAGTYSLAVKSNTTGCISFATATVANAFTPPATPSTTNSDPTSCSSPDGFISVNNPSPTTDYTFSKDGGLTFQAGSIFPSLTGGTYNIVAKSKATGCVSAVRVVTLTAPFVSTPSASVSANTNCAGTPNGSITVNTPGPAANFTFSNNGGISFQPSNVFNNLPAGSYQLVAKSNATGCISAIQVATIINSITPISAPTITSTDPTQCTVPNGSITVNTPASGVEYSINGGLSYQVSNSFTGLASGSYAVVVRSTTTGCISPPTSRTLQNSPLVQAPSLTSTNNSSCSGTANGSITVVSPLGANIQYSLNGGAFQSAITFTGLTGGTYSVVARNTTTGCTSSATSVPITNTPESFTVSTNNSNPTICTPPGNGQITVTNPAVAGYTFSKDGGITYQASNIFSSLAPGTYSIVAKSNNTTCVSAPFTVTLTGVAPGVATVSLANNTNCIAPGNGSITFSGPPLVSDYSFSIDGGITYQASPTFGNLIGGTYRSIARSNINGCTTSLTDRIIFDVPAVVSTPIVSASNVTNCGTPNGSITITGPGSIIGGHTYSVNNGISFQAGLTFNNLPAGVYNVVAKNTTTGCVSSSQSVTITAPVITAPTASASPNTNCSLPGNGSITVSVPASGVTYSIDGGVTFQASNIFSNLSSGNYSVVTKDNVSGCISSSATVTVIAGAASVLTPVLTSASPTNCNAPNGNISISSPLGANILYSINNGITYQASTSFNSLAAGTYIVVAKNSTTGCVSFANTVTLTNPFVGTPSASTTSNTICGTTGNGSINVLSPSPVANYTFSINNGLNFQASPLFTGLLNGTYLVKAKDNTSGCISAAASVPVLYSPAFVSQATTNNVNNTDCLAPNGSITISAPTPTSGFTFSKDGGISFQASNLFSNLPGGTYSVVVKSNASGCTSTPLSVIITDPATTTPSVTTSANTNCGPVKNGSITFNAPAAGTGYVYSIDGGTTYQAGNVFSNLNGGTYPVMVRNTTTNCVSAVQNIPVANSIVIPSPLLFNTTPPSNCSISDGTITFTSPAPVANFSFSIDGGVTYFSSPVFNNLAAGSYALRAKSIATGCETSVSNTTLTGTVPASPVATGTNPTTCTTNDGVISFSVAAPASLSSYNFSIDGGVTFQANPVFNNLAAGTYNTVFKLISTGCNFPGAVITLAGPSVATPLVSIVNNSNCVGAGNGSISITSPVGPVIEYSIDNGTTWQPGTVFSSLLGGLYNVRARNTSTGCVSAVTIASVLNVPGQPGTPVVSVTPSNSCITPTGQITFTTPSPEALYSFSINAGVSFQASSVFANLSPGTYTAVAKNNSTGCVSISSATVTVPVSPAFPSIISTFTNPASCSAPDGSITFTQPTPFSSFQFSKDGGVTYQNSPAFTGLGAGIYTLKVKSLITGCEGAPVPATITLNSPAVPVATVSIIAATKCSPGDGKISFTAPSPLGSYQFSIDNGVTFQNSPDFSNLVPGTYNAVARNIATGCRSAMVVSTVNGPSSVADPVFTIVNPSTCGASDGSVTVTAPAPLSNYEFSKDNGATYQVSNIFNGLNGGIYNIRARELSTGCVSAAKAAVLNCLLSPLLTKTAYKNGGNVPATVVNINDVVNYVLEVTGNTPVSAPSLTDVMSNNQRYIANSAVADNWTLNGGTAAWFGPLETGTATAVYGGPIVGATDGGFVPAYGNNVYISINKITGSTAANVTFSGGGDGFRPIYWKTDNCQEKVMVKNHHSSFLLKCWNLTTNTDCNNDLTAINASKNYNYTVNSAWTETINNKVYTIDISDGSHGVPNLFPQVNCIDLNPAGNPVFCAGYPKAIPGAMSVAFNEPAFNGVFHGIMNYDAANDRVYWAYDSTQNYSVIYGLNLATGTISESAPILTNGMFGSNSSTKAIFLATNRLLIEGSNGTTSATTACVDISNWPAVKDCNPANLPGVFTAYGFSGGRVSPLLNNAGAVTGFCTGMNSCYTLNGTPTVMPAGYIPSFNASNNYLVSGTKVITLDGYNGTATPGQAFCFDFATNQSCGSTNSTLFTPYATEWRVPGKCFLTYGDGGVLTQWGIEATGLVQNSAECQGNACTGFSEIVPDPVVRFCGPQPNNIMFDELQITNIPVVHNGSTVAIKCGGTVLATYNIPPNVSGFVQDISGVIDHNTCPTPEITISFKGLPISTSQDVQTKVTYTNNGRFPEICYDAKVVACDGNQITNSAVIGGGGTVTVQASISIASGCIPLPVTLTNFTAGARDCAVKLNWQTAEELSFDRFEVERSTDGGSSFSKIASVRATGTGSSYSYTDNSAVSGKNLYRLKMVDIDEKSRYSKILLVSLNCDGSQTIILYPNPVKDRTTITGLKKGDRIDLVNVSGQVLLSKTAVNEQEQLDLGRYPNGLYAVIVSNKDEKLTTIKVVKQ